MTPREDTVRRAVAAYHLGRKGPTAPRHGHLAAKLLLPVIVRQIPDRRPEDGRGICSDLSLTGMTLERDGARLVVNMSDNLLALPEAIRVELTGDGPVELRFDNAMGGDADAAMAVLELLQGRPVVSVVKYAASAHALVAACHAGHRRIHRDGALVLHAPATAVLGDWRECRRAARRLRKITEDWVGRLVERTGRPEGEVAGWFCGNTVFDAQAAIDAGLADELFG